MNRTRPPACRRTTRRVLCTSTASSTTSPAPGKWTSTTRSTAWVRPSWSASTATSPSSCSGPGTTCRTERLICESESVRSPPGKPSPRDSPPVWRRRSDAWRPSLMRVRRRSRYVSPSQPPLLPAPPPPPPPHLLHQPYPCCCGDFLFH